MKSEEPKEASHAATLNWLRAGVLGANDGIVSVSAVLLGMIGARATPGTMLTAGFAALVAGAVSMALGEYVSVSAQRDSEKQMIAKEIHELKEMPEHEHQELKEIFLSYGMQDATAEAAVTEIEAKNALPVHLRLQYGIDGEDLTNPWAAAFSSAIAFTLGALLPLLVAWLAPMNIATVSVVVITLLTLALAGWISASISKTPRLAAIFRLTLGGTIGLALTYGAGALFGAL